MHIFAVGKLTETVSFLMCYLLYTFISFERKKTTRAEARSAAMAEAFQPGYLTWRALASCRHCLHLCDCMTLQDVWGSGYIFYTRARLVSAGEVQCLMPFSVLDLKVRWSHILWLVSVSNDRVTWSDPTEVFVYDSKCLECDDESGNSTCEVKVSHCVD